MNVRELVTVLKFKTDSASLKSAENAVNRIKTIMQRTKPLNLKVNTGNAQKSVNALTSKLNQLQQNKRVRINVDTSQIDKATQSLNRLSQAQVRASQAHFSGKAQGLAQG
jgi:DNA-binding ferritin-like protein